MPTDILAPPDWRRPPDGYHHGVMVEPMDVGLPDSRVYGYTILLSDVPTSPEWWANLAEFAARAIRRELATYYEIVADVDPGRLAWRGFTEPIFEEETDDG